MTKVEQGTRPPKADVRWLGGFVMQHKTSAILSLLTGAIGGVTLTLEPYLIGIIIDHVREGIDQEQLTQDILLLIGLSLVTLVAFFGQRHFSGIVAYGVSYDIRQEIFDNMVKLDQGFYNRHATGDLISRMYSDMNWIWRLLALTFMRSGSAVVVAIMAFVLLATVNLTLTVVVFVILAVATTLQIWTGLFLVRLSEDVQDQAGVISSLVQDSVTGIETIKTFGKEAGVDQAFWRENQEFRRRWLYFKRMNEPVGMLPQMMIQLATGAIVLLGGWMTINGTMTLGNFAQFLLYLGLIRQVMLQLGTIYQRYVQAKGALQRLTPLLQKADIRNGDDVPAQTLRGGEIRFENVSYRVGDTWLLRDIDLHIKGGEVIGLVGATGCGKTTLVNLLARVMDVSEGRLLIDGHDVRALRLEDLREAIAYVPQTTFLFSQPLHENIRMGKPDLSEEDLMQAVHISRMSNDLPQLANGLETMVGEKGVMLSGGQKQRVAIARAIARDPAILVLDDALSSVDTQTAADILADMRDVMKARTSIIIAHRMATVRDADRILVMAGGRIVASGTHEALMAEDGLYASMVKREREQEEELLA